MKKFFEYFTFKFFSNFFLFTIFSELVYNNDNFLINRELQNKNNICNFKSCYDCIENDLCLWENNSCNQTNTL